MMKIEEIKTGSLVLISSLIENEIDGIKRRLGALGMVEAPVFGTGGMWWWIVHQDGSQVKYRYCEISEMKTIRVPAREVLGEGEEADEITADREDAERLAASAEEEEEQAPVYGWVHQRVEKWID